MKIWYILANQDLSQVPKTATFFTIPLEDILIFLEENHLPLSRTIKGNYSRAWKLIQEREEPVISSLAIEDFILAHNAQDLVEINYSTSYLLLSSDQELRELSHQLGLPTVRKDRLIRILGYLNLLINNLSTFDLLPKEALWLIGTNLDCQTVTTFRAISKRFAELFSEAEITEMIRSHLARVTRWDLKLYSRVELEWLCSFERNQNRMACGNGFDLVIANPYQVYSWGTNKSGQLGHGKPSHRHTKKPKLIPELFNIQAVAAGSDHSLALTYQGQVYSWGANSSGQLGLDHFDDLPTPTIIPHLDEIVAIFARHKGSLALNAQGQVYEWGILCTLPVVVSHPQLIELEKIINIAAGDNYCLFLTEKGEVWGAGYNDNGGMGFLNGFQHHPLRLIPSPDEVVALYVINGYSWFLNNQGEVYLVGDLGDATFFGEDGVTIQPLLLPGLTRIVSVVKAYFEILFLNNRGEVLSLDLSNLVLYLRGLRTPSFFHGNSLNLQCCSGNSTPLSITREGQLVYLHQHTASVIGEVEIY